MGKNRTTRKKIGLAVLQKNGTMVNFITKNDWKEWWSKLSSMLLGNREGTGGLGVGSRAVDRSGDWSMCRGGRCWDFLLDRPRPFLVLQPLILTEGGRSMTPPNTVVLGVGLGGPFLVLQPLLPTEGGRSTTPPNTVVLGVGLGHSSLSTLPTDGSLLSSLLCYTLAARPFPLQASASDSTGWSVGLSRMGQAASECALAVCTALAHLIKQQPKLKAPVASVVDVVVVAGVMTVAGPVSFLPWAGQWWTLEDHTHGRSPECHRQMWDRGGAVTAGAACGSCCLRPCSSTCLCFSWHFVYLLYLKHYTFGTCRQYV